MCLNARSIVNKKNELNIMVEDTDPHIIGITESWANTDITDAELGLTAGLFDLNHLIEIIDLNHDLNHSKKLKKSLIYDCFDFFDFRFF